jgi:hypothetical protein
MLSPTTDVEHRKDLHFRFMAGSTSAKGDTGLSIACVRCAFMTGRWLCFRD